MTVKELIEKRAKAWEVAKEFVNSHEDRNGNLNAEDAATYSGMESEIEELTNSIDRQQRAERREQELSKPVNSPLTARPYKDEPQGEVKGRATDEYKQAMLQAMRSNFRQVSNVLQEGVDGERKLIIKSDLIKYLEQPGVKEALAKNGRYTNKTR